MRCVCIHTCIYTRDICDMCVHTCMYEIYVCTYTRDLLRDICVYIHVCIYAEREIEGEVSSAKDAMKQLNRKVHVLLHVRPHTKSRY